VLALGAMLKSTFSIFYKGNSFLSQYIGDSNSYETQLSYLNSLTHVENILDFKADIILSDKHPGYFSSELAEELALKSGIPNIKIQHHEAHFAAILGEYKLWNEKILGIVWDGTGLGNDQHIWGGECFLYEDKKIHRRHHLSYQKHILGDKMVEEPRISALSFFKNIASSRDLLKSKFTALEWEVYQRQLTESTLHTSSMGRLFDAVASILSIKDKSTFHGQAAMLLEAKAAQYDDIAALTSYRIVNDNNEFDLSSLLSEISDDINKNIADSEIAARFHLSLVDYIQWMASQYDSKHLCFSGGVFQNKLLVELIRQKMHDHTLYFHQSMSPNDESISFGQLMHYFHIAPKTS
jgi:hydrogenase maturation protein HypF